MEFTVNNQLLYMKKHIGKFLIGISLAFMTIGPLYQMIDSYSHDTSGDGETAWGDNPIFRNILGVKKMYSYSEAGDGWHRYRTDIETPRWMQGLGLPKIVSFGQKDPDNWVDPENEQSMFKFKTLCVILLRWCIKLLIPVLLIVLGSWLSKTKKEIQPEE